MKTGWTIAISAVLTAVIIGGGTYYFVNARATKDKDNLQAQITDLTKKVADAEKSLADAQATTSASVTTAPVTTPDPTAGWKTYANSTYKFSYKYPSDWLVKDMTSANKTLITGMLGFFGSNPTTVGEDSFFNVQINSQSVATLITAEKAVIAKNANEELVSESAVIKYGQTGTELRIRNKTTGDVFGNLYLPYNSRSYVITSDSTATDAITTVANQMNDTFQFTK